MKMVFIGLSRPRKWKPFSWLQRAWFRKPYSHVYFRWTTSWGHDEIYEANGRHLRFMGGDHWHKDNRIVREWEFKIDRKTFHGVFLKHFTAEAGRAYGFTQLIGMAIAIVFKMHRNPFGDGAQTLVCSEEATRWISMLGIPPINKPRDMIVPADIEKHLDDNSQ